MKFAIIPWDDTGLGDCLFFFKDENGVLIPKNNNTRRLRDEFYRKGHEIHTIDYYNSYEEIDYFLFFVLDWKLIKELAKKGLTSRMVYCNAEPPTVTLLNTPKGYEWLKNIFPYILTWNPEWIDNVSIFKRNIPYVFKKENRGNVKFEDRKLLTGISGNKQSNYIDELYSERERVYTFFEDNYPQDFTFYGTGWDKKIHSCYGGKVNDKSEVFHNYKFAICFENTKNVKGYVTEKIFDCISCGIVPIYAGAKDILDYVPQECFIDYFSFADFEELACFIKNMSEEEYIKYIESGKKLMDSNIQDSFSGEEYARNIIQAVSLQKAFHITSKGIIWVSLICFKEDILNTLKKVYRWICRK